jgi:hypothetical protein
MDSWSNSGDVRCAECSAPRVDGMTCWEQLGLLLSWEYDGPELQAEHFLTVASYNLQHPAQFVDEVLDELRSAFIAHLDHALTVQEIRRRIGRSTEGNRRVLRAVDNRKVVRRVWPMTIADVYIPHMPDSDAGRVRSWAASIRNEF